MKSYLSLLAGVAAVAFSVGAFAQAPAVARGVAPGTPAMDCAKAKDKARCESLNKDIEACRGKTDDAWRECMHRPAPTAKFTPPKARDCTKARNTERCEAHAKALGACKDKTTKIEHRRCMSDQLALGPTTRSQ